MNDILKLLIFSLSSVVYLFIISRMLGKKEMAQLDFIDFTMSISIGSIASEFATDISDKPYYYYLIAMLIFALFHIAISLLERKGPMIKNFLRGRPLTLIYEGRINYKQLKRSRMDMNDLITMAREKGYPALSGIYYAILENTGKLSVIPIGENKPPTVKDLGLEIKKPDFPAYIIIDGHVSYSALRSIGKDEAWLLERLDIKEPKQLKNYLVVEYINESDSFNIAFKKAMSE